MGGDAGSLPPLAQFGAGGYMPSQNNGNQMRDYGEQELAHGGHMTAHFHKKSKAPMQHPTLQGATQGQPQQPQAPFGGTSAMGPTPNRGHEAAGMQKLGMTIKMLEQIIPLVKDFLARNPLPA